jgi:hypothetical protein
MLVASIIFAILIVTICLSAIAVFADVAKHDNKKKDTLKDILNNK